MLIYLIKIDVDQQKNNEITSVLNTNAASLDAAVTLFTVQLITQITFRKNPSTFPLFDYMIKEWWKKTAQNSKYIKN